MQFSTIVFFFIGLSTGMPILDELMEWMESAAETLGREIEALGDDLEKAIFQYEKNQDDFDDALEEYLDDLDAQLENYDYWIRFLVKKAVFWWTKV